MPRDNIPDGEILDTSSFSTAAQHYYEMPGIVVAFTPGVPGQSPPVADVQPAVHDVRICVVAGVPAQPAGTPALVEGQRYSEPWPVIPSVPVKFPMFGGLALWGNLKKGDKVQLRAFDLDPSTFLATGQPSDPPFTRRNGGTHWYAIAGDLTDGCTLTDAGAAICLGTPGGVMVTVDGSHVNLGAAAPTDAVSVAGKVDPIFSAVSTFLTALKTYASGIKSIVDPGSSPLTTALDLAIAAMQGAIVPTGSLVVKSQP